MPHRRPARRWWRPTGAGPLLLLLLLLATLCRAAAPATPTVETWIAALLPADGAATEAGTARPPAIALLGFEPGTAVMTVDARAELDALAAALLSDALDPYVFEIRWYADPKKAGRSDQALSERRAAAMYGYLQTRRGIMPTRVMLRWSRRKPMELATDAPADSIVIKLVNLGRQ